MKPNDALNDMFDKFNKYIADNYPNTFNNPNGDFADIETVDQEDPLAVAEEIESLERHNFIWTLLENNKDLSIKDLHEMWLTEKRRRQFNKNITDALE